MDCTVKGNLPSEIFEDIKKIADNRINFQQLKNKTVLPLCARAMKMSSWKA